MSIDPNTAGLPADPWRDSRQRFPAVAMVALLSFGVFALYDGREFYRRYIRRCENSPDRPECNYVNAGKPKSRPNLGINMDQENGRWAIQFAAPDEKVANDNVNQLWAVGASPRFIKITGRRKAVSYYVQLGRFKSQKDAISAGAELKSRGLIQTFVVAEYRLGSQ